MNKALITGITSHLAHYLCEIYLRDNWKIHGMYRRSSSPNFWRVKEYLDKIELHCGDLCDEISLYEIINKVRPDLVLSVGAQSFVGVSWEQPLITADITALGPLRLLSAIHKIDPKIRFIQMSSSEIMGKVQETPQTEKTPHYPRSPYGISKLFAYWTTINYRESYNMWTSNAIAFNFTSPYRGIEFITKKVVNAVAKIKLGLQDELRVGNIESRRDWTYAYDVANAVYLISQLDEPDDFIIGSGETHSIKELIEIAFNHVGLNWENFVIIDPRFYRPAEVDILLSNPSKLINKTGWSPTIKFDDLIKLMVETELKNLKDRYDY